MNRLEFIFRTVNAIASKKHDVITEFMLAQAVLHEIDTRSTNPGSKTELVRVTF